MPKRVSPLSLSDLEVLAIEQVNFRSTTSLSTEAWNCDGDCGGDCFMDSCNPGECDGEND